MPDINDADKILVADEIRNLCTEVSKKMDYLQLDEENKTRVVNRFMGIKQRSTTLPYYKSNHAEWLIDIYDKMLANPQAVQCVNCKSLRLAITTARLKISQAWQYIQDNCGAYPRFTEYERLKKNYRWHEMEPGILAMQRRHAACDPGYEEFKSYSLLPRVVEVESPIHPKERESGPRDFIDVKNSLEMWLETAGEGDMWTSKAGFKFTNEQLQQLVLSLEDVLNKFVVLVLDINEIKLIKDSQLAPMQLR